jgi:general secretion pathway protein L
VADLIEAQGLKAESARLQAAIAATYRQAFPESRRLVNPKAQMEQGLAELRRRAQADAGGLPSLLTHAARALGEVPAVELKGLQYQQQEMDLTLQAPDLASLEEIRNRLSRTGAVQAELRSASTGSRQVEGQLRVRGVGP